MRTFDLAPLYRATVGFDQIADIMDRVLTDTQTAPSYPPYNIEKTADDAWRISVAVAGFAGTGHRCDAWVQRQQRREWGCRRAQNRDRCRDRRGADQPITGRGSGDCSGKPPRWPRGPDAAAS